MTTTEFRSRIRTSLDNQHLQKALDVNAERRVTRRINALAALPDWRERRQRAHAIRAEVIEHLDEYLAQFTAQAQANGIIVHRAKDAAEAVQLVIEIAKGGRRQGGKYTGTQVHTDTGMQYEERSILVAKSKSMVTEEIRLNPALEQEGMRVVETDLGEFIVQLRNERPSHIITPALHLTRRDVGKLFHEKLGIEYTEDIPTLTNTARKVLREVFLTADVGVTGANFAIADQGGICLVTNEGNGRMMTTLPPTHIALIGMERMLRNLDDLALMLSLLPRSATGQKISVYTQVVKSPLEGQQRHFILLDNGRSRLRNSPLKESLYCIRCGSCLNACPIFREVGGHAYQSAYPGPIGSVISAGLFGSDFVHLAQASTLCGACKDACPVDIDLPKLLTRVRAGQSQHVASQTSQVSSHQSPNHQLPITNGLSPLSRTSLQIFSRLTLTPKLFAFAQTLASLTGLLLAPRSAWMRLPEFTGWGYSKDLPRFAQKSFRSRWNELESIDTETGKHVDVATAPPKDVETEETLGLTNQTPAQKAARFEEELTAVHGHVHYAEDVTGAIIQVLQARGITRVHLEPGVLNEEALSSVGITFSREPDPSIRAGVTKAVCGVAETGSVFATDGEGSPLHASLLPEMHLVVLPISRIHASLETAIHHASHARGAAMITGPSATGDIESVHTIGVHGPGEVHAFLVDD